MAAAVVVALFIVVPLVTRGHQAGTLHVGSGDAIVNWTSAAAVGPTSPTTSFSGSVDGLNLSGAATPAPGDGGGGGSVQSAIPDARWKGTLGASPIDVAVTPGVGDTVVINGTWGTQRIHLTVAGAPAGATGFVLHGTVGQDTVTGSTTHPVQSGRYGRVTATLDVVA